MRVVITAASAQADLAMQDLETAATIKVGSTVGLVTQASTVDLVVLAVLAISDLAMSALAI